MLLFLTLTITAPIIIQICTACLPINLEEAAITCSRNQSDPTCRVTGMLQAPFPSCQQTFFFWPMHLSMRMQRRAWTFRYVVEGKEDQALRVVLTAVQHVPIFQALSVATSSSECIRYEQCQPSLSGQLQYKVWDIQEMQLRCPRIAAGMRAKPPVCEDLGAN